MTKSLFIFRRDLRLEDNTSLIECCKNSDKVYCVFIMTPEQLKNNTYKSDASVQFMYESLKDLKNQLNSKINFYYGKPYDVVNKIIQNNFDTVYVTKDYTFYSRERDEQIKTICDKNNVNFISIEDHMLNDYGSVKTTNGRIYSIFTPYYNKAIKNKVSHAQQFNYYNKIKSFTDKQQVPLDYLTKFFTGKFSDYQGGRRNALSHFRVDLSDYSDNRNSLSYETSRLSAYIKYGCVSIREVYHKFNDNEMFIRQLYWHDFYTTLGHKDIEFTQNRIYQPKKNIRWLNDKYWKEWKDGYTGFPIVDATMKQLKTENYCHNRGRLIASGFIKFMFMDWKVAEQYYATQLRDYSPYSNYYNWNWSLSFGPFSTPYFRIMNVWSQGKKADKDCIYIKKWLPELKNVDNKHIHDWENYHHLYDNIKYPKPIVNYKEQREKCLKKYKKIFST
jgi:deoxyribodipyrimidine photo-lyase